MYLSLIFFTRVNEDLRISNWIQKEVKSARGPNVETPDRRRKHRPTPALTGPLKPQQLDQC